MIINKLCAYICSPFTLASEYDELTQDSPAAEGLYKNREQEFYIHKAELQAEADVRLSIIKEIHARLQGPDENTPGAWSGFEYDFSGSIFFYPVDLTRSYYTKPVHFSESVYWSSANFSGSTYRAWVGFSDSTYRGRADFSGSTYRGGADFHESIYQAEVDLSKSVYQDWVDFHESTYWGDANFSESAYRSWADFYDSTYQDEASFTGSTYQEGVDLSCSIYWGRVNFRGSIYEDEATFSGSIFQDTIDFGKDTGSGGSSRFTRCAPAFYDEANQQNTLFGAPNNDFSAENSEGCPILLTPDELPLDCRFLSTAQKDYLGNTLHRLEETNDEFLAAKNHEVEKELSEKLRSLTQELHDWREKVTALPPNSPNNTGTPQQTKLKRAEEEVPWFSAGGEALSLLDDYRKNGNDHAKIYVVIKDILESHENQIKILAEQTQQCLESVFRQRMAERRGRYTKAVEQLGNASAPVRIGGVYTLVGLADEWLLDESLAYLERVREGQVIINNLCTYIRSPFALVSHYDELTQDSPTAEGLYKNREQEFYIDKATIKSEADIRLNIIKEIRHRLQGPDENTPGAWSDFEYDFSGSTFFYPVDLTNSYYTKPVNFSGSTYQDWVDFSNSIYQSRADFNDSTYRNWADFRGSIYQGRADFNSSTYQNVVYFSDSTYRGEVCFNKSTYQDFVYFDRSIYQNWADFYDSTYQDEASFTDSTYLDMVSFFDSTYQEVVSFSDSAYWNGGGFSNSIYQGEVDFSNSIYVGGIGFSNSAYRGKANFSGSIYQGQVGLSNSTYEDETAFSGSIFRNEIYCGQSTNSGSSSRFTQCAPEFYDETNHQNTLFGSHDNNFTAENGRGYPIYRNLKGLPLGCAFLAPDQREYLKSILRRMEEISNKIHTPHTPDKTKELSEKLRSLTQEIHEWREKVTTAQRTR
ncbi:hypothetical protein RA11412_0944 [Rothia aeria]|uniref:Uncharacterized protein n=1 Tax=Rothia aeria TaxID=172042 RepID=A0A2Z5QY26_9MICC|nr:hypothetical protein RA11412_0944 [Rothia aeria]